MKVLSKINDFIKKDYKSANLNAGFMINPYAFTAASLPIAFDANNYNSNASGTTATCTITIGSNSNRLLLCGFGSIGTTTVTNVRLNGVDFTQEVRATGASNLWDEIWSLVAPATGAGTVTVTFSASTSIVGVGLLSLYNVNQATPVNGLADATNSGNSTSPSVSVTPTNTGSSVVACCAGGGTASAQDKTQAWLETTGAVYSYGGSYILAPTIGSANVFGWTQSSNIWCTTAIEVKRA